VLFLNWGKGAPYRGGGGKNITDFGRNAYCTAYSKSHSQYLQFICTMYTM